MTGRTKGGRTYVISDLHGCYHRFLRLLQLIRFTPDDTLYVLGDTVDRGPHGIPLLLDLSRRENVCVLCGNHDRTAYRHLKGPPDPAEGKTPQTDEAWPEEYSAPTKRGFRALDEEGQRNVLTFLSSLPLHREVTVGGRAFFLAHTVPDRKRLRGGRCRDDDFLWGEPEYEKPYFTDKTVVTGHTPTAFIDPSSAGRIWQGNGHIAVDCGAVFGRPLGCLCLDTLEEFYVPPEIGRPKEGDLPVGLDP